MAPGAFRVLTNDEEQTCRDNGIDPHGKSVVLAGTDFLILLHHKTGDNIRINYGLARQRTGKGENK